MKRVIHYAFFVFSLGNVLLFHGPAFSAPALECTLAGNGDTIRHTFSNTGVDVWYVHGQAHSDFCITFSGRTWHTEVNPDQEREFALRYGRLANNCGETGRWEKKTLSGSFWQTDCSSNELASGLLFPAALVTDVADRDCPGGNSCNQTFLTSDLDRPALLLQTPLSTVCLIITIRMSDLSTAALLRRGCLNSQAEAERYYRDQISNFFAESGNWFGATVDIGGFALAIDPDIGTSTIRAGSTRRVWGENLDENYISSWLQRIGGAASTTDPISTIDDPMPFANTSSFLGKLSRWLVAGLIRTSSKPFSSASWNTAESQAARNWMTRNVLSDTPVFAGTLFRGELARKDWSQ